MRQVAYFVLQDRNGFDHAVLCIAERKGLAAMGLSLCSYSENKFKRAKGMSMAKKRALDSLTFKVKENENYISREEATYVIYNLCWEDYKRLDDLFMNCESLFTCKSSLLSVSFEEAIHCFTK